MKIAVPVTDGTVAAHFGHCTTFTLFDVDPATSAIAEGQDVTPPPHEPGVLPAWLSQLGVTLVIAAGIGSRAQSLFAQHNITVVPGVGSATPQDLVQQYLAGHLPAGNNRCDH